MRCWYRCDGGGGGVEDRDIGGYDGGGWFQRAEIDIYGGGGGGGGVVVVDAICSERVVVAMVAMMACG